MADVIMLGAIGASIFQGFRRGFIRRLAGLVFLAVAFVLGAQLRVPAGALLHQFFPLIPEAYAEAMGYSVAFGGLLLGLNLLSGMILSRVAVRGASRGTDMVLGAILGAAESVLIISAGIVILHTYTDPNNSLSSLVDAGFLHDIRLAVDASTIGQLLEKTTVPVLLTVMGPFLPTDIKSIVPIAIPGGLPGFPIPGFPGGVPLPSFPQPS